MASPVLIEHLTRLVSALSVNPCREDADRALHIERESKRVLQLSQKKEQSDDAGNIEVIISPPLESFFRAKRSYTLPDFCVDSELLRRCGFGVSDTEVLLIQDRIRALARKVVKLDSIRVWGKLLGTDGDYLIAEGSLSGKDSSSVSDTIEPRGVGANRYTYFAYPTLLNRWTELSHVCPEQVVESRKASYILSGDPTKSTPQGCPEAVLLRSIIARISAATVTAPDGFYTIADEEISRNEDFALDLGAVSSLENWKHAREALLKSGRTMNIVKEGEEPNEDDPEVEKLRVLTEDDGDKGSTEWGEGGRPAWRIRVYGDKGVYGDGKLFTVAVSSQKWPGAVTVAGGSNIVNWYCGYGMKSGGSVFLPIKPSAVLKEPAEGVEQPEPFPLVDDTVKPVKEPEE